MTNKQEYDKKLDLYRDNNWFIVYKCLKCEARAIGAAVTLHDKSHGPMVRELTSNEN